MLNLVSLRSQKATLFLASIVPSCTEIRAKTPPVIPVQTLRLGAVKSCLPPSHLMLPIQDRLRFFRDERVDSIGPGVSPTRSMPCIAAVFPRTTRAISQHMRL